MASLYSSSIYDKVGGDEMVTKVTNLFYDKVMSDVLLIPFFAKTDMVRQRGMQAKFLKFVLGGYNHWEGKSMASAHKHLKIGEEHFIAVAGHLQSSLRDVNIEEELILQIMAIVETTKQDIVTATY